MNKKIFLYLTPNDKRFYKTRNERFIIDALRDCGNNVIEIKKFYVFNLIKHYFITKADGIIFNSLKIGNKCEKIFKLKKYKTPKFWWYFDSATFGNRYKKVIKLAKQIDLFFNKEKKEFKNYVNEKINPIWLDQGVPSICKYTNNSKNKYELGFFGSASKIHSERTKILRKLDNKYNLAIYSKDYRKFKKNGFKNCFPPVNQSNLSKKVSEIKITLCFNSLATSSFCWSDRVHLMIGSGAFTFVEYVDGISNFYQDNKDCIFFRDSNDLLKKISLWMNSKSKNKIRREGFKTAHRKNSYRAKVEEFLQHLEDYYES